MRAPTADAECLLVLVSPYRSPAWELWPEPRTVALSTRYSVVCYAELPRAAIFVDLTEGSFRMDRIVDRPGALDVHKASVTACVRVWEGSKLAEHLAEFKTTVRGLLALRDWLEALDVKQVAMEATGVYWRPVWAILEDRFELMLVNARQVKQVPGRKTDINDAQWLCQLLEAGLLKASFVAPKPIRTLRNLTRYRKAQISDRQREAARLHKILEDTGIKLDCVASDILGASGRAMLDALVSGTKDPDVLADLAKGKLRKKLPALREALEGRFDTEHALIVSQILAHIDFLDEAIDRLSDEIEERIAPFAPQRELLKTIPRRQPAHRRGADRRDRRRHERLPHPQAPGLMGRHVPRERPVRRQTPLRQNAQGLQVAALDAHRIRARRRPNQQLLPRRPIPTPTRPPRPLQSGHRRRPLDPHRRLAHAPDRRAAPRPRQRLLHPSKPRPPNQAPHPPTRSARTPRHPPTPRARGGRRLTGISLQTHETPGALKTRSAWFAASPSSPLAPRAAPALMWLPRRISRSPPAVLGSENGDDFVCDLDAPDRRAGRRRAG